MIINYQHCHTVPYVTSPPPTKNVFHFAFTTSSHAQPMHRPRFVHDHTSPILLPPYNYHPCVFHLAHTVSLLSPPSRYQSLPLHHLLTITIIVSTIFSFVLHPISTLLYLTHECSQAPSSNKTRVIGWYYLPCLFCNLMKATSCGPSPNCHMNGINGFASKLKKQNLVEII